MITATTGELRSIVSRTVTIDYPEDERPAIVGDRKAGGGNRPACIASLFLVFSWDQRAGEWTRALAYSASIEQQRVDGSWGVPKATRLYSVPDSLRANIDAARPTTRITITEE